jgi:uncharacterized protein (UPF0216 family)
MTDEVTRMIAEMNVNLPVARKALIDCLESGELTYRTRSGDICEMERSELLQLSSYCDEVDKYRLRVPIMVSTDVSGDEGVWKVDGPAESKIVSAIIGHPARNDSVRFYHPDLMVLMKKFPTTLVIAYLP